MEIKESFNIKFEPAKIIGGDALEIKNMKEFELRFDACITSPPYYFSIDYVGKDKIAYDYLGIDTKKIEAKYLGMREFSLSKVNFDGFPHRVATYYQDLRQAVENIFWALKPGGKLAIIVGDSTVGGKKNTNNSDD